MHVSRNTCSPKSSESAERKRAPHVCALNDVQESDHAPCNTCKCSHLNCCDCSCLHIQQTPLSDASQDICKPPSRLDRPCVPIQQAETNHFLMRLGIHLQVHPALIAFAFPSSRSRQTTSGASQDICKPPSRLDSMASCRLRKQSVHAQTPASCHVHSPDSIDSMANESNQSRHRKPRVGVHGQAEEAAESLPLQNLQFCAKPSEMEGWVEAGEARAGCGQAAAARKRHQARQTCRMTRGWWQGWW